MRPARDRTERHSRYYTLVFFTAVQHNRTHPVPYPSQKPIKRQQPCTCCQLTGWHAAHRTHMSGQNLDHHTPTPAEMSGCSLFGHHEPLCRVPPPFAHRVQTAMRSRARRPLWSPTAVGCAALRQSAACLSQPMYAVYRPSLSPIHVRLGLASARKP